MKGYIKNVSSEWAYAMKRAIRPGGEVPLRELFEQYGKKYDMEPNDKFVDWLQSIKLKNSDRWKIVYDFEEGHVAKNIVVKEQAKEPLSHTTPMVSKKLQVEDIVNLTVRKAREELPKINDLGLLKFSLSEARQLTGKDSLCRLLHKRVSELQISR